MESGVDHTITRRGGQWGGYTTPLPLPIHITACYFPGDFSVRFHKVQREIIFGDELHNIYVVQSVKSMHQYFCFFERKLSTLRI